MLLNQSNFLAGNFDIWLKLLGTVTLATDLYAPAG